MSVRLTVMWECSRERELVRDALHDPVALPWASIRGRSCMLRVNYRTSHQIRTQADRLLGPVMTECRPDEHAELMR
jgi:hypothetical protein